MSSVKTAISLPSEMLEAVDRRAAQSGESRSALIRAALDRYLDALEERDLRERIREAYGEPPDADELEFERRLQAAAAKTILRETEW
jgi:Arc/MetJ-type ribon-helix-helix transcriptional regulator